MNRVAKLDEEQREARAAFLNDLFESLELDQPTKVSDILAKLYLTGYERITSRTFRSMCEEAMYLYQYNYMRKLVVGTNKGYIYTNDNAIIDKFLKAKHHQFLSLATNYYSLKRCMENEPNMTIEEFLLAEAKHLA